MDAPPVQIFWNFSELAPQEQLHQCYDVRMLIGADQAGLLKDFAADQPETAVPQPEVSEKAGQSPAWCSVAQVHPVFEAFDCAALIVDQRCARVGKDSRITGLVEGSYACGKVPRFENIIMNHPFEVRSLRLPEDATEVRSMPQVDRIPRVLNTTIDGGVLATDVPCAVIGSVVRYEQLEVPERLGENRLQCLSNELLSVVDGESQAHASQRLAPAADLALSNRR